VGTDPSTSGLKISTKHMPRSHPILEFLVSAADQYGDVEVNRQIRMFKNRKQRALAEGRKVEKRRAIPKKWIERAAAMQSYKCSICGEPMQVTATGREQMSGDHTIALADGGLHESSNVTAAHRGCNSSKGAKSVYEDARRRGQSLLERNRLIEGRA
jgi:5-methylcytosine-specific restriction endonuclease McrA